MRTFVLRRTRFCCTDGSTAIEFAIVGNAFIMLIMAIAYVGMALWHDATLGWAVERGARVATLNSAASQTDVSNAINGYLTSVGLSNATVQYTVDSSGGTSVGQISASMTESFNVPLFSPFSVTYTSSANVPLR